MEKKYQEMIDKVSEMELGELLIAYKEVGSGMDSLLEIMKNNVSVIARSKTAQDLSLDNLKALTEVLDAILERLKVLKGE